MSQNFTNIKTGSKFKHNGRIAQKTGPSSYTYVGSNDSYNWNPMDLMMLQMILDSGHVDYGHHDSSPSPSYDSGDSGSSGGYDSSSSSDCSSCDCSCGGD